MINRTQEFTKTLEENLDKIIKNDDISFLKIDGSDKPLPRGLVIKILKKYRFYELEDISDIERNYKTLTKGDGLSFSLFLYLIVNLPKDMRNEKLKNKALEYGSNYGNLSPFGISGCNNSYGLIPKFNFNFAHIENVTLDNIVMAEINYPESCEFNIRDRKGKTINGVFVYGARIIGDEQEQIRNLLMAPPETYFDLGFLALNELYLIKRDGKYQARGKQLLVHRITRHDGNKETNIGSSPFEIIKKPVSPELVTV